MAKKKINIILIIAVLGLWGTVGFKTINRYFGDNTIITNAATQTKNVSFKRIDKDTFALEKINRDPFLNKQLQEQATPVKLASYHNPIKKAPAIVPKKTIANVNWPTLKYFGYLKSKDQELVLLKIDSKLHKLKLNDPVDGLVVKRKFKDSIEVSFNSESRIIHLR
jgi:hypothetical protein